MAAVAVMLGVTVLGYAAIHRGPTFVPLSADTTAGSSPGQGGSPGTGTTAAPSTRTSTATSSTTSTSKPTSKPLGPGLSGTWVLQQANSVAQVDTTMVEQALSTPRIRGYSLRVPWSAVDGNTLVLNAGAQTAAKHRVSLAVRFMAGMYTPASVFAAGSPYYISNGVKVPTPFMPNGSPNTIFESSYRSEVGALAAWCRGHGVHELHMSWYGRLYAQFDNSTIVNSQPGYTYANWLNAHERLVNIAWAFAGSDLTIEFPVDGADTTHHATADLTRYIDSVAASHPTWFYQQTNGLGVYNTPPLGTVPHAQQMYGTTDYDWNTIFSIATQNRDMYLEIYASSFSPSLAHHAQLLAQIATFG